MSKARILLRNFAPAIFLVAFLIYTQFSGGRLSDLFSSDDYEEVYESAGTFQSALVEPWNHYVHKKSIQEDFRSSRCMTMDSINYVWPQDIRIMTMESREDFDDFLKLLNDMVELEALRIEKVDLSEKDLEALFEGLADKKHFIKLMIRMCEVRSLPPSIAQLKKLETLDLFLNRLTSLPDEITQLTNLQYLSLYSNRKLRSLPEELGKLEELATLDISSTGITELPVSIEYCYRLVHLSATAASLESVTPGLGYCEDLRYLSLAINDLDSLPAVLSQLNYLENLNASYNQLKGLPASFYALDNLEYLFLSNNEFNLVPESILGMDALYYLNMSQNPLHFINLELGELPNLKHLTFGPSKVLGPNLEDLQFRYPDLVIEIEED